MTTAEKPSLRVAVTGAQGFMGAVLCERLARQGYEVDAIGRREVAGGLSLSDAEGWAARLTGVDAVVHLAARAHVTKEHARDPLALFREVNVEGTRCIARAAVRSGVRRFVFVSSIGVFGTSSDARLSEQSPIAPQEPYAITKWEAEQVLRALERDSAMEVVVVRPTLVYGPHAKGNFLRLMRLVASGVPLPFGSVANSRSFIGVANLCDLLEACVSHPRAAGQTFVAADDEDISTSGLLTLISKAMGRPDRQFRLPLPLLRAALTAVGRKAEFLRLTGSLRVDARHARSTLQWQPRLPLQAGIEQMVQVFMGKSS
jgi:nucleoside-diphosphate-sugar epimerase